MRKIGRNGCHQKKMMKRNNKTPKRKIQDAYTLLYMCASWIFSLFATNSLISDGTQTV